MSYSGDKWGKGKELKGLAHNESTGKIGFIHGVQKDESYQSISPL